MQDTLQAPENCVLKAIGQTFPFPTNPNLEQGRRWEIIIYWEKIMWPAYPKAMITNQKKSLMCSHIDHHCKEKLKADSVRE